MKQAPYSRLPITEQLLQNYILQEKLKQIQRSKQPPQGEKIMPLVLSIAT